MKKMFKVKILGEELQLYEKEREKYFLASEIGKMLSYSQANISKLVAQVEEDEKLKDWIECDKVFSTTLNAIQDRNTTSKAGKRQYKWFLTKDGLFELLFLGKNEKSKIFKTEVKRVLKEIDKNGYYISTDKDDIWTGIRQDTKEVRKTETDTIKEFVELAQSQGSSKPKWYYKHFTELVRKKLNIPSDVRRDKMEQKTLLNIQALETVISMKLNTLMLTDKNYKEIYQLVKELITAI